jgi:hypothetical protein
MEKLTKKAEKKLGVNSTEEVKRKLTEEMKKLGLSKIDVIYYAFCTISNIIVYSVVWTLALFFFYNIDHFSFFNNKPFVFNIKTIFQIVGIFLGCVLFFSLITVLDVVDFVFHYRLNRAISFRFLKDLKKYGIIKELFKDLRENNHSNKRENNHLNNRST